MIKRVAWIGLLIAWFMTLQVHAREITFGADLGEVPWQSMRSVALLAFIGGLFSTLSKFAATDIDTPTPRRELAKDFALSVFAGFIGFGIAEMLTLTVIPEALLITLSGWSGAKMLDAIADTAIDAVAAKLRAIFGR